MAGKVTIPYRSELISLAMIFLTFIMVKARLEDIRAKTRDISAQKQQQEQYRTFASGVKGVVADYSKVLENFMFPDSFSIKKVFQEKAWENDVDILSIKASQSTKDILGVGFISGDFKGKYSSIVNFIKSLESVNIRVDSIDVAGFGERRAITIAAEGYFDKNNE